MRQNTIATQIGIPFAERYYLLRERKKVARLKKEGKNKEATKIREKLLDRYEGGLENAFFSALYTRDFNPEERRFSLESRRRIDLKHPNKP